LSELYLFSLISCRDNTTWLRNPKTLSMCYCFLCFSFKSRYRGEITICKLLPVWILALRVWVTDSVYISSRSMGGTVVPLSLSNFFDSDNIGLRQPLSLLKSLSETMVALIRTDFLDCINAELSCSIAGWKRTHRLTHKGFNSTIVFIQHQKVILWRDI